MESETKKTLIVCREFPLPEQTGTNLRTMNFVRFFKEKGPVDIAYVKKTATALNSNIYFRNQYGLNDRHASQSFNQRFLSVFINGIPYPVCDIDDQSKHKLRHCIIQNQYDYVLARYIHNTKSLQHLLPEIKGRIIIDIDDIFSDTLYDRRFSKVKNPFKKILIRLNRIILRRTEMQCFNFDAVLFCSSQDRDKLKKTNNDKAIVVPNIYNNESFLNYSFGDGFSNGNNILFVGTLNYRPNLEGLEWFLKEIFPEFKRRYPRASLSIVGKSPREELKSLCRKIDGINLIGDVDDLKIHYQQCRVVVVPILSGGGTRIKILEAVMANRPVMSTPKGMEGLSLENGEEIYKFRNAREFCDQYEKMGSHGLYNRLVKTAKRKVKKDYSVKQFNTIMESILDKMNSRTSVHPGE